MSPLLEIKKIQDLNPQALSALHKKCFEKGWSEDEFQSYLTNPIMQFWAAFHESTLIGFLLLQVIQDDAEVLTFCVDPKYQGQGIGKKIVEHVIQNFSGTEIILDVAKENASAQSIYKHFGFKPFAIREQYYKRSQGVQEDAVVMKLKIK